MTELERDWRVQLTFLPRQSDDTSWESKSRIRNRSTGNDSPEENYTHMATEAQIEANRKNAQHSTGPTSPEGKARSCMNRLSHGFNSSVLFIAGEKPEEFNLLLADLHTEFQPATTSEQILLEKMVHHQWFSLRACRLQSVALNSPSVASGYMPKDLGVLIRYQQSSDRGFYKARNELLTARKERQKSEIRFESQDPAQPPAEPSKPPDPPQETTPGAPSGPGLSVKTPPHWYDFDPAEDQLADLMTGPDGEIVKNRVEEILNRLKAA